MTHTYVPRRTRWLLASAACVAPQLALAAPRAPTPDKGDTAWVLVSTALVVMMVMPGVALFYGGLVRAKNVLSVLVQVIAVASLVSLLWVVYGYSLAFDGGGAWWGGLGKFMLRGVGVDSTVATFSAGVVVPELAYVAFQGAFAAIACALIVGATAERARFSAVLIATALWFTLAYVPLAHVVWSPQGWLFAHGAIDFAGGTVVHINAGVAGLVGAWRLGPRVGYGRERLSPHNLPLTLAGAALLWVGWFGFNAGSALEANGIAALALLNTHIAACAGVLAWCACESLRRGKASLLGGASGAIAGLVAITPACGTVGVAGAMVIGAIAGCVGVVSVGPLKRLLRADDTLDVFGIHGSCGIAGALLTALFTAPRWGGRGDDAYRALHQLAVQALGVGLTVAWSALASLVAFEIARRLMRLRVTRDEEREGLDIATHGEAAYGMRGG